MPSVKGLFYTTFTWIFHRSVFSGLTKKKKKRIPVKKVWVKELDWKWVIKEPISKEKLKLPFRNYGGNYNSRPRKSAFLESLESKYKKYKNCIFKSQNYCHPQQFSLSSCDDKRLAWTTREISHVSKDALGDFVIIAVSLCFSFMGIHLPFFFFLLITRNWPSKKLRKASAFLNPVMQSKLDRWLKNLRSFHTG